MSDDKMPEILTPKQLQRAIEEYVKDMESLVIVFIGNDEIGYQNSTLLFVRKINAQKQVIVELMFSEKNVPDPDKPKTLGYVS